MAEHRALTPIILVQSQVRLPKKGERNELIKDIAKRKDLIGKKARLILETSNNV